MSAKHALTVCLHLIVGLAALLGSTAMPLKAAPSLGHLRVFADLGGGWRLWMYGDGSARLTYGANDSIGVPAGTFPVEKCRADFQKAVDLAGPTPDYDVNPGEYGGAWRKAGFAISRADSSTNRTKAEIAVFTPEIKAYCDKILSSVLNTWSLATEGSAWAPSSYQAERMRKIISEHPVYSEKLMRSLAASTNLLQRSAEGSANSSLPKPDEKPSASGAIKGIGISKEPESQTPRKP